MSTNDVSTLGGTQRLIAEASSLGPVGGVFHLAMVTHHQSHPGSKNQNPCPTVTAKGAASSPLACSVASWMLSSSICQLHALNIRVLNC